MAYSGLVLNEKGYERLAATDLDEVHFTLGGHGDLQPAQREPLGG